MKKETVTINIMSAYDKPSDIKGLTIGNVRQGMQQIRNEFIGRCRVKPFRGNSTIQFRGKIPCLKMWTVEQLAIEYISQQAKRRKEHHRSRKEVR